MDTNETIVRELVEMLPWGSTVEKGSPYECWFCSEEHPTDGDKIVHEDWCLWKRADNLLPKIGG